MGPKRRKRSKVWLHFTEKENNRATCNTCKVDISSKGGNTTNMQKHLHTQHAITLSRCRDSDPLRSESQPGDNVSTSSAATVASVQALREFINKRLTAAAAEIFTVFEQTIVQYEEVIGRQRRLLELNRKPQMNLHTAELIQHHDCREQQLFEWETHYSLEQVEPEPPQVKEEPEEPQLLQIKEEHEEPEPPKFKEHQELGTSQEGERLTRKFESDSFKVPSVEEQSSLSEREEVPDTEQFLSRDPEVHHLKRCIDSESTINAELKETGIFHSDRVDDVPASENQAECEKLLCEETRGEHVRKKPKLCQNLETLTDRKKISCEVCNKSFSQQDSLLAHMRIHTAEKPYSLQTARRGQPGHDRLLPVAADTEEKLLSAISALSRQVARLEQKLDRCHAASEAREQRLQERMAAMEAKLNSFFGREEIKQKTHSLKIAEMVRRIHNSEDNILRYDAEQGLGSPRNEAITTYLVQTMAASPDMETVETDFLLSACKTYYETLRRNFQAEAMKSSLEKKENVGCKEDCTCSR